MKRILLISFEYPIGKTYCGGVGQIVKQCRNALLELGCETYVLISSGFQKKYPVKLLLPDDSLVRYANFWAFQKHYDWHEFNYIIQHFVNWTKELRKLKSHRGARPRIIYHFHSILRREKDSGFKTFNQFLLNQERMIEIADKIICPSRYEYDNFIRYFPYFSEKVTLIENTMEFFPLYEEEVRNIRNRHRIKDGDIVSMYVGRLERIKGADLIIKNAPKILNKHKNLKIFIIGKTLERNLYRKLERVQRRFPHQFFYFKYLEKKLLFQYYYLSQIYVNTSLSESFSLTTHESALCNNALLLNSLPVFDKFKGAALFFSNHEPGGHDFISKYRYLIQNGQLRSRLAQESAKIAKDFLAKNRLKEDLSKLLKAF
jgi:glycosyltransferase involved in cell wall biosynthesis